NRDFLKHENRLWEMQGLTHLLPPNERKNEVEARIWREIDRCSVEKEIHWRQQRMSLDTSRVVNWLGRLLSRPGIEEIIDSYPRKASALGDGDIMTDIWSSPTIKNLKGPDGKPFLEAAIGEGRYLFSLAVDGFNPFHNKTAKLVVSSTGFFIVLLNFPPHLRYLFENMCYVGSAP
ncbi:hypothetical protein C8R43DRAFT_834925, partial [Mycena crocata]